jgi:hypothetical protein
MQTKRVNKAALAIGALGALTILAGCGGGYGYHAAGYGEPDVYYDGFYGAYTDGYWGPDAGFYYRGGDGRFIRDEGNHFRHGNFEHARGFHARAHHD